MEKNQVSPNIIIDGQTVVCTTDEYIQEQQPRLTPTGKISHAKTRVYTQRYRKEWELMPDFKGWLTSVDRQPTRAYCTYCKKNLHAHRLSLLKHTCTMKHQRAALMYQTHMQHNQEGDNTGGIMEYSPEFETIHLKGNDDGDIEDDNDEENDNEHDGEYDDSIEYVDEQLDMEDEEQIDQKTQITIDLNDDSEDFSLKIEKNEHCNKKIKLDSSEDRDTLAEAMAHVHGEYFDDDDGDNSDNGNNEHSEDHNPEEDKNTLQMSITEVIKSDQGDVIKLLDKKITDDLNINNISDNTGKKVITAYQVNTPHLSAAEGQQIAKFLSSTPTEKKTMRLLNGKTLTITPGKIPSEVLNKLKANTKNNSKGSTVTAGPSEKTKRQINLVKNIKFRPPPISTHVMDTSKGIPVSGLQVSLYKLMEGRWTFLNESTTLSDGRCTDLVDNSKVHLTAGRYKIHFDVDKYFTVRRIETMYPFIEIVFDVKNPTGNYHIPVLLSPHSYTTYRDTGGWPSWNDSH